MGSVRGEDQRAPRTIKKALRSSCAVAAAIICGALLSARAQAQTDAASTTPPPSIPANLTPFGAEVAGNASGSIPAWNGGLAGPPPCFASSHGRYCDPFADDQPLYTVTAENVDDHAAVLSPGQRALFAKFPDSYRMRVFPTRRSFANPPAVYAATQANMARAVLADGVLKKAATGLPFPLPANGAEALWNHRLRWRPLVTERVSAQFAVAESGDFAQTQEREFVRFDYGATDYDLQAARGILSRRLQWLEQPARQAGVGILIDDVADPGDFARRAWQFGTGDEQAKHAPNLGYDTPGIGTDDLRSNDQIDMFFGPLDRYDLKLLGKQEMLVPANSYALHSADLPYRELIGRHHLNPDFARYELRRVWVVDATLKRGSVHACRHRRFYLDEDGWQIRVVDNYDNRGELWRVQEAHTVMAYDRGFELPVAETVYDLPGSRYLVQGLNNEEPEVAYPEMAADDFGANDLARRGRKLRLAAQP
ncbi:DUF1329 domain-containing protein [Solimonas terrae]|uniref:DUF1329 domain-containing protein n=1 Tax=Solimonas terrae TaxID=1396819 RepID=A0A6M2BSD3_9GAMM|nr:DUF1329 domain-containing protein [Solimonas terrae]NGY05264.1 DUF1329 domain-containing protein [Solimonas terrae]